MRSLSVCQAAYFKMSVIYQITKICMLLFILEVSEGAWFFESLNVRLVCYVQEQDGCNTSLPEAHPEYGWGTLNLTKADTHLYLFTPQNKDKPELLHICGGKLPPNSKFNRSNPVIFIIPGYVSGVCNFAIFRQIKNEFVKRAINVILVDWMWGNIPDLIDAKNNTEIVAHQVALVVKYLKDEGVPEENITCMGHSVGAHVCGRVSNFERVGKIDGIEPAGVIYTENDPVDQRLDRDDAKCVQVIHTNGGQCLPKFFGVNFTCGTADFWVNGGLYQPSCYINTFQSLISGDFIFGFFSLLPAACSHFQALQYYKASINPCGCEFVGVKCENPKEFMFGQRRRCDDNGENCAIMGADACRCLTSNQLEEGNQEDRNYCVKAKFKCPYCDNKCIDVNGKSCNNQSMSTMAGICH